MNTKTLYLNKEGFKISTTSFKNHLFAHKVSSNRYQVSTVLLAGQILNLFGCSLTHGFLVIGDSPLLFSTIYFPHLCSIFAFRWDWNECLFSTMEKQSDQAKICLINKSLDLKCPQSSLHSSAFPPSLPMNLKRWTAQTEKPFNSHHLGESL
jgi:hypothetical protein